MGTPEFWILTSPIPQTTRASAIRAEREGWDGFAVVDTQCMLSEAWVELTTAACATARLKLATRVTNPVTRHPSVTAAAAATLQHETDGRIVLGIGRGDSSLAYLGLGPTPLRVFRTYLEQVQAYLRGEEVPHDPQQARAIPRARVLELAGAPPASRLQWLDPAVQKVPVDVAASGPKVIAAAAQVAEQVTFAMGADVDRLRWGIEHARAARSDAGLDPDGISLGAYLQVCVHPDRKLAREFVAGGVAAHARLTAMHGRAMGGGMSDEDRQIAERVRDSYDMRRHGRPASQTAVLTNEFIDRFAVVGSAEEAVERFQELIDVGVERLVFSFGLAPPEEVSAVRARLAEQVLPALR